MPEWLELRSHLPSLEQLLTQGGVAVGERTIRPIFHQAASIHFELGIQVVGMVQDQAFRH